MGTKKSFRLYSIATGDVMKADYDKKNKNNDSYLNGTKLVCKYQTRNLVTDVVFIGNNCLAASTDEGKIFYIKRFDVDSWGFGQLNSKHTERVSILASDISNNLLFSGSWDTIINAYDVQSV